MDGWWMGGWMDGNDNSATLVLLNIFCEFVNVCGTWRNMDQGLVTKVSTDFISLIRIWFGICNVKFSLYSVLLQQLNHKVNSRGRQCSCI